MPASRRRTSIRRIPASYARALAAATAVVALCGAAISAQQVPETGAPRTLWPQRPGTFRSLNLPIPLPQAGQDRAVDEPQFVPNQVLLQYAPESSDEARAAARAVVGAVERRALALGAPRLELVTTTLPVPESLAALRALPQVEFAEPNWIVRHYATSNDPFFTNGSLYGMYGDSIGAPPNEYGSQAAEAWAKGFTGSSNVYVAVIDEGIDFNHPDLAPNIWTNPFDPVDGLDNDGNGKIDDIHGWDFANNDNSVYDPADGDDHGTHVAGTIGARGGNGIGVAGVNWNVRIISAKFLRPGSGTTANAIQALDYVTDLKKRHGLNIVATNNSWGGSDNDQLLHGAIIRAAKEGILFIAAAGNSGSNNDATAHYPSNYSTLVGAGGEAPASYEAVIAVAAIADGSSLASFSNYGATTVDIGAPGVGIVSTVPQNQYGVTSGTSMATPHVTGAAALYKSINPGATPAQIRQAILGQAIPTASLAGKTTTGSRLNVGDFGVAVNMTISDARVSEGHVGTKTAAFTVSLSAAASAAITVDYQTSDITAVNGSRSNTTSISVPSFGAASPYPSAVTVPAGLGTITKVKVILRSFTHTWPTDVDVLLVGPTGQTCVLMSDVGNTVDAVGLTFTFDDAGPSLPSTALSSGTFKPTNVGVGDTFPLPAPGGPHGMTLAGFNGTNPDGLWRLFVADDQGGDTGSISGGWSLVLSTTAGDYEAAFGTLTIPAGSMGGTVPVTLRSDTILEGTETFKVTLSNAVANLADSEGTGTIVNDDFTDASLAGQFIRAVHITELRTAVNEARAAFQLGGFSFTDPALSPQSTTVRAVHITELRAALAEAYAAAQRTPPSYTDPVITPGVTTAKTVHITELRAAVAGLF